MPVRHVLGVVTFCWTPVSLFFDYAMSPSSRLRLAMLVPKVSLILSSRVVPEVLRKSGLARCRVGFSRLSAWCHRVGTCPGSGGSTNRWR